MNTKLNTDSGGWFPKFAGVLVVGAFVGAAVQAVESPVAKAYVESCVAPYHEELVGWQATQIDYDEYKRVVIAARKVAAVSCSAFVERMERIEEDSQLGPAESRMLQNARDMLAGTSEGQCLEARSVVEVVRSAESLYQLALCKTGDEEQIALMREAVETRPGHLGALLRLTNGAKDPQVRAEYGARLYQRS